MLGIDLSSVLLLVAYAFVSNVAIAVVPHEPAIILAGGTLGIWLTVWAASLGTAVAAYVDHRVFNRWLASRPRPEGGASAWLFDRFERAPFVVLAASGLLPLPMWPFKVLALSTSYPRWRYVAAISLGRLPRYLLLAASGDALSLPTPILVMVSVGFALVFMILPLLSRRNSDV